MNWVIITIYQDSYFTIKFAYTVMFKGVYYHGHVRKITHPWQLEETVLKPECGSHKCLFICRHVC